MAPYYGAIAQIFSFWNNKVKSVILQEISRIFYYFALIFDNIAFTIVFIFK